MIEMIDLFILLAQLGVTSNYRGSRYTAYAVCLALENADRLLYVTKWLYPDVARHFNTTVSCVERNIRTAAAMAWERNPELLRRLAGFPIAERPTASQLIAILTAHLSMQTTPA